MNKLFVHPLFWLFVLVLFALLVRLPYVLSGTIPFGFDHGRDLLSAMDIVVNHKLKFVGPWTSIPGLFFGPTWYYLVALFLWIGGLNPIAPTYGMIFLVLIQVVIAWNYFGRLEALIVSTTTFWLTISQSAWNPFPIALVSWIILVILKKNQESKKVALNNFFWLGFLISLGTHFSSAYAVFYPIIVGISIYLTKIKLKIMSIAIALVGFVIPFVPQILFEIKNNFNQTKSVVHYFASGGEAGDILSLSKITTITFSAFNEIRFAVMPAFRTPWVMVNEVSNVWFLLLFIVSIIYSIYVFKEKKVGLKRFDITILSFICIPVICLWFLHYNYWYLTGMMPAAVVLGAKIINLAPSMWRKLIVVSLVLTPLSHGGMFIYSNNAKLQKNLSFLPVKQEAISYIRTQAGQQPFSVYVFASDIYDFPYQYLWLEDGFQNNLPLPVEFAYEPNVPTYLPEKDRLLARIAPELKSQEPSTIDYFVVEKPQYPKILWQWWRQQQYDPLKIMLIKEFGEDLKIYEYKK